MCSIHFNSMCQCVCVCVLGVTLNLKTGQTTIGIISGEGKTLYVFAKGVRVASKHTHTISKTPYKNPNNLPINC